MNVLDRMMQSGESEKKSCRELTPDSPMLSVPPKKFKQMILPFSSVLAVPYTSDSRLPLSQAKSTGSTSQAESAGSTSQTASAGFMSQDESDRCMSTTHVYIGLL